VITTVAGIGLAGDSGDGGLGTAAQLRDPVAVAVDGAGDVFVADVGAGRVRRVDGRTGRVSTAAGLESVAASALAVASDGALLVGDSGGAKVVRRSRAGALTVVCGNGGLGYGGDGGPATAAHLSGPAGLARDGDGNLYIADARADRIRRIDARTARISTVAGNGERGRDRPRRRDAGRRPRARLRRW